MALNLTALTTLRAALMTAVAEAAGEVILAKSNELIAVDEAIAQRSGRVVVDGNRVVVTYGKDDDGTADHAPSNDYIEIIHEDMEMNHPHGGQAKFLQTAGDEAAGTLLAVIAGKVRI